MDEAVIQSLTTISLTLGFIAVVIRIFGLSIAINFSTSPPTSAAAAINGMCVLGISFVMWVKTYVQPDLLLWFACIVGLVAANGIASSVSITIT